MNASPPLNRRVVIFGGAGYIGPVVTRHLLNQGFNVRIADLFLYSTENLMISLMDSPNFETMRADQGVEADIDKALVDATDVVVLGGLVGDPITAKYPGEHAAVNEKGIHDLINKLHGKGLERVIFVSTCSNYGLIPEGTKATETFELTPLSLYAKAKVANEQHLLSKSGKTDYTATVLRFATAFGLAPRMRFDLTVNQFTREMFFKTDLLVYDPDTWRPYCHVADFADIIERVLKAPKDVIGFEVFNAGGDVNNFTKRMVVETIQKHLPDAPLAFKQHGTDPRNYRVDFNKIKDHLNFTPSRMLEDGIVETIKALEQGLFRDVDERANFYGNYELNYPIATA